MKSLLVDVLRQAKDGSPNQTLSDSGSFDTTQDQVEETANDAVVATTDDQVDELQLFETSASLDASFDLSANEETAFADGTSEQVPVAGSAAPEAVASAVRAATRSSSFGPAPVLARFAPVICVAAALFAAVFWIGYQQLALSYSGSDVASSASQVRDDLSGVAVGDIAGPASERFPFIDPDATSVATGDSE